jgi:hypothetical protein
MTNIFRLPKEINHKGLFLFGFLFYFVCPVIVLQTALFNGLPGIDAWKSANALNSSNFALYIVLITWFFVSFYLGSFLGQKYTNVNYSVERSLGKLSSALVLVLVAAFTFFYIFKMRGVAFKGYAEDVVGNSSTGIISTTNLLIFYLHFVVKQPKNTKRVFLVLLIINSIFLLGLGGRMYVLIPIIAYIVRAYNNRVASGKPVWPFVVVPFVGGTAAGIIGTIRMGGQGYDLIPYFVFAEPIFTSYSAFSYLNQNHIPLVSMPYNIFVAFVNIIPSIFWPGRAEFVNNLISSWMKFESPLGAMSLFVSVFADFGSVLGGVFMMVFGGFFGHLYKAFKNGNMNRDLYYCFISLIPFSFFRDPIGIPIKLIILSFTVLPFLIQLLRNSLKH